MIELIQRSLLSHPTSLPLASPKRLVRRLQVINILLFGVGQSATEFQLLKAVIILLLILLHALTGFLPPLPHLTHLLLTMEKREAGASLQGAYELPTRLPTSTHELEKPPLQCHVAKGGLACCEAVCMDNILHHLWRNRQRNLLPCTQSLQLGSLSLYHQGKSHPSVVSRHQLFVANCLPDLDIWMF